MRLQLLYWINDEPEQMSVCAIAVYDTSPAGQRLCVSYSHTITLLHICAEAQGLAFPKVASMHALLSWTFVHIWYLIDSTH